MRCVFSNFIIHQMRLHQVSEYFFNFFRKSFPALLYGTVRLFPTGNCAIVDISLQICKLYYISGKRRIVERSDEIVLFIFIWLWTAYLVGKTHMQAEVRAPITVQFSQERWMAQHVVDWQKYPKNNLSFSVTDERWTRWGVVAAATQAETETSTRTKINLM